MFFFRHICNKFAIRNNPLIQLIFTKQLNKSHRLSSFSAIKKTVTGVEVGTG